MKRLVPMFDNSGARYSIPEDRVDEFRADMGEVAEARRYRDKDGKHYTIPQDQDEAFRADMPDAVPVRSYTMADGTRRDFTMSEMSKFLRSKEYRESEDYTPPQMGSPTFAGVKGALAGAAEGAYYGGKNAVAKVVTALPEAAASVGEAVGNAINLGGNAKNAVGDWLRASGKMTKRWLGENIRGDKYDEDGNLVMSGLTKDLGYEDTLTKIGETAGDAAAMAVKFAPAAVAGPAYMETILASDGINAFADTFDRVKAAGYSDAQANLAGTAAGLINYYGAKLMMKGGAATKDIANPLLRALAGTAFTGAATGAQAVGNKGVENAIEGKPITEGMLGAAGEGFVEGAQFHLINEVGTNARPAMNIRRETREMKEMRKENLLTATETPDGRAFLNSVVQNEGVDAAIRARKEGKDVSRKMGAAADLPDNMSAAERNAVIDGIAKAREAQAAVVKSKLTEEAVADIDATIAKQVEAGNIPSQEYAEEVKRKAIEKLGGRENGESHEAVEQSILEAAGEVNKRVEAERRLRTPTRVGEKEIAEYQEARAMGRRIEAEGEAQRKAAAEKAQADYDEKMAAYEEARAKRAAEKKRGVAKDKLTPLPEKPTPPELRVEERKKPVIEADLSDLSKKTAKVDKETGENAEIVATNAGKTDKRDISHSSHLDIYTPGDAPGGVEGARIVKSVSGKTGEKKFQIVLKNGESIDVGPVGKNGKFGIRKGDDIRGPFDTLGNAVRKANELYGGEKEPTKVPDGRGRMIDKPSWRTSKVDEVDADGKPYTESEKMQLRQDKAMTFIDETFKDSSRKNLEAAIKAFEDIESEGGFGKDSSGASPVSSVRRVAHQIATSKFATPEEKARFKEYYEGNPQPPQTRENAPSRAPDFDKMGADEVADWNKRAKEANGKLPAGEFTHGNERYRKNDDGTFSVFNKGKWLRNVSLPDNVEAAILNGEIKPANPVENAPSGAPQEAKPTKVPDGRGKMVEKQIETAKDTLESLKRIASDENVLPKVSDEKLIETLNDERAKDPKYADMIGKVKDELEKRGKLPQPSQTRENATSRAPQETQPMSQAEAKNENTRIVAPKDDKSARTFGSSVAKEIDFTSIDSATRSQKQIESDFNSIAQKNGSPYRIEFAKKGKPYNPDENSSPDDFGQSVVFAEKPTIFKIEGDKKIVISKGRVFTDPNGIDAKLEDVRRFNKKNEQGTTSQADGAKSVEARNGVANKATQRLSITKSGKITAKFGKKLTESDISAVENAAKSLGFETIRGEDGSIKVENSDGKRNWKLTDEQSMKLLDAVNPKTKAQLKAEEEARAAEERKAAAQNERKAFLDSHPKEAEIANKMGFANDLQRKAVVDAMLDTPTERDWERNLSIQSAKAIKFLKENGVNTEGIDSPKKLRDALRDFVGKSTRVPDGKGKMKDVDVFRKSQQEADARRFALKHKMDEERKKLTEGLKITDDVYVHKIAERDGYSTVQNNMGIGDHMEPYGIKNASAIERALNETENLAARSYGSTKDFANDKLNGMKKALSDAGYEIYGEQDARKIRKISDVKAPDGKGRMVKKPAEATKPSATEAKAEAEAKKPNSIVDADTARTDENWGFRKATNAIEFQEQMDALEKYQNSIVAKYPQEPINPKTKKPYGKSTPQYREYLKNLKEAREELDREVERVEKLIGEENPEWGDASEARANEIVEKFEKNFDKSKLSERDKNKLNGLIDELSNALREIELDELREITDIDGEISTKGIYRYEPSEAAVRVQDAYDAIKLFSEQAGKYQRLKRDADGRPIFQISEATPAQKLADPDFKAWAQKQGRTPTDGARRIYDAQRVDAVFKVAKNWLKGVKMRRSENAAEVPNGARMSIGNLYTGSAADYEKPSLLKVGTGEGTANEAWGLYATEAPGVAGRYASQDVHSLRNVVYKNGIKYEWDKKRDGMRKLKSRNTPESIYLRLLTGNEGNRKIKSHKEVIDILRKNIELAKEERESRLEIEPSVSEKEYTDALRFAEEHGSEYEVRENPNQKHSYVYEQTMFTDRPEGDMSHLIDWDANVGDRIISLINRKLGDIGHVNNGKGVDVYNSLSVLLGGKKPASEFLRDECDIDGIVYDAPTSEGYGHGNYRNYVSFRDDNIRVDHKWVDGKIRYLYSRDGNVVGWYDRAKKELVTLPGADAATVAHELGWHATYDYAQAEAAQGRTALLDKLNDYAANAPQSVKNEILRKYGMATDAAVLLDEIGAARYTMDNVNKIKDAATRRQTAKWYQRTWNAIADTYKAMLSKMGWNKARLDNLSALTPEETVNLLADEMLKGRNLGKAKSTQIDMSKGESIAQLHDRKLKDRLRPIEEIEKDAGKSVGNSAYTLFRTLPGKVQGAIDKAQNFAEKVKADCKKAGIKIEELNEFLYASAASERNAKVLSRNGRLDGSAMSHADIQRILSAYRNSPKYAELRRIADDVLAFQRKGFDFRRKAGLISDETWNTLLTDEPNHVPMKSRFDPNGEHMGFSLTEQFGKPEWKTAEGRTNVGDGPLEWIVQEYVDAFSRGHENVARRALLETVLAHPEVGEVKKLGPNDAIGEVKRKGQQGDPNVFVVKTDGDTYQVKLNGTRGELIARAVSGRGLVRVPQSLQKAMRWWSATATSWSPTFAVRNFLADTVDVFAANIGEKGLIKGLGASGKHVKTALKLTNAIRKYASTGETTDPLIREAVDAGVLMGGGVRSQAFADAGEAALKTLKTDWRNGKNRVKTVRNFLFGWIDTLNQTAELMNRMADYKLQREAGKSKNEAALHAREITVDFNEKGELTPVTNMLYMFSNSTLGATMRLNKAIFASKEGKSLAAGTFALGLIEGAVEAMANGDDEDGKNMNEYTRANSFYFRKGKDIYRIPLHASPISVIKYAGNCTARKLFGTLKGDKAAEQIAKDMIGMMTSFLGIGALGDNEAASIAPTIIQPFLQAYMNRDFADRPIERTSFSEEKPKSGNGRPSTPQYYHDLAKWLNEFGGGNAGRKGEFLGVGTDFSPEMLKHFNEATGKNALRDIENTVEFVKMVLRKTDWDRRNIPVGRDYFRTTGGNDNRFFEAVRAYKTDASDFKERTGADRKKFEDSHPWLKEGRDGRTTVNRLINMTNRDKPRDGIEEMGITQLRKLTEGKIRRNDGTYFKPNTPVSDELKEKAKEWLQKRQARVIEIMGK